MAEIELLDEIVEWLDALTDIEHERVVILIDRLSELGLFEMRFTLGPTARCITYRFTKDGRIVLPTTFRKQRNNERVEIERARKQAQVDAGSNP
jgi:hypothetical protein